MKSFQVLSAALLVSIVVAGCSGGGSRRVPGRQCPLNYKPIVTDATKIPQKLYKKGDSETVIPAGTYTIEKADMVYTEDGNNGVVVHVQDTRQRDGSFKPSLSCVRNGGALLEKGLTGSNIVASKIISKLSANPEVEVRQLIFLIKDGRIAAEAKAVEKTDSLEKAYTGKAQDFFMLEAANKVDYEIRSTIKENGGEYVLSVRLKRVP